MPKDKDLKRLVRRRMEKTGESYTAARAQIVAKSEPSLPEEHEKLAGMSDAAVRAKTGRDWAGWVRALDAIDAAEMAHRDIALHLHEAHDLPGWWAQMVTVGYERIRGLREVGQRRDGDYEISKSKTIAVPVNELYGAFADERRREAWLGPVELEVRTATTDRSMRITWEDGTFVDAYFTAKGDAKSAVSVQHRKLPDAETGEELKEYWGERLAALAELLTKGR